MFEHKLYLGPCWQRSWRVGRAAAPFDWYCQNADTGFDAAASHGLCLAPWQPVPIDRATAEICSGGYDQSWTRVEISAPLADACFRPAPTVADGSLPLNSHQTNFLLMSSYLLATPARLEAALPILDGLAESVQTVEAEPLHCLASVPTGTTEKRSAPEAEARATVVSVERASAQVIPLRRQSQLAGDEAELAELFNTLWQRLNGDPVGHLPPVGLNFSSGITNRFGERVVPADSLPQEKIFNRPVALLGLAPYGLDIGAYPATRALILGFAGTQRRLPLQLDDSRPAWPRELRLQQRSFLLISRQDLAEAKSAADLLQRCRWGCNTLLPRWRGEIRALFTDLIEQSESSSATTALALARELEQSVAPAVELVISERRQRALLGRLGMTPTSLAPLLDPEPVYPIFNCSYADWQFACIWLHLQPLTTTLGAEGGARAWQVLPRQPFHVLERRLALAFGIVVRPEIQQLWESRQCLFEQGKELPFMDHALLMAKLRARVTRAVHAGEVQHPALLAAFANLAR